MKISFKETYNNEDQTVQSEIKSKLEIYFIGKGGMPYYMDNLELFIQGIQNGLLAIAKEQNLDSQSLSEKTIDITKDNKNYIIKIIEENIDTALSGKVHSKVLKEIINNTMYSLEQIAEKQDREFQTISPDTELKHIIEFIETRWEGFDKVDIKEFFTQVWEKSLELSKYKIDDYSFIDLYEEWGKERKNYSLWQEAGTKLTQEEVKQLSSYDFPNKLIDSLLFAPKKFDDVIMSKWDYSTNVANLLKEIKVDFPEATKLRPKGWKKLEKNYSDFDGQEEYCENQQEIDDTEFKGIDSATAGSFPFQGRVALPYVMYDDKCQGRKPLHTLVGAVLGHAYAFNIHNNTQSILKQLYAIKEELSSPQYYKDIVLSFDIESKLEGSIMKGLYEVMKDRLEVVTESELDQRKKEIKEAEQQPVPTEEEIVKRKQELAKMMQEIFSRKETSEDIAKRKQEKEQLEERVWEVLSVSEVTKRSKIKMK